MIFLFIGKQINFLETDYLFNFFLLFKNVELIFVFITFNYRIELLTFSKLVKNKGRSSDIYFKITEKHLCTDPVENLLTMVDETVFRLVFCFMTFIFLTLSYFLKKCV